MLNDPRLNFMSSVICLGDSTKLLLQTLQLYRCKLSVVIFLKCFAPVLNGLASI